MGNEFGHPEWIDFPRDDTYDPSTGEFVPGAAPPAGPLRARAPPCSVCAPCSLARCSRALRSPCPRHNRGHPAKR